MTYLLLEILGKSRNLVTFVEDRPGHDLRYAIDTSKAERELGWKPEISFESGIQETIQWYLSHQEWVERIRSGEYQKYYDKQYGKRLSN